MNRKQKLVQMKRFLNMKGKSSAGPAGDQEGSQVKRGTIVGLRSAEGVCSKDACLLDCFLP